MSEELQSILMEDLRIKLPGVVMRRIALNRHIPRVEKLSNHVHPFRQILLYLRGAGEQHLEDQLVPVSRGTVLSIPAGKAHRFVKSRTASPICLAIDLETDDEDWPDTGTLNRNQLATVETRLFDLNEIQRSKHPSAVAIASRILRILAEIEEALRSDPDAELSGPVYSRVRRVVEVGDPREMSPRIVAKRLDRSLDHLNRQLGIEVGITVGEIVNRSKLDLVRRFLKERHLPIGEVGSKVGFDDQNYFSRWFRKHTGQTPTQWRSSSEVNYRN